MKGRTSRRHYGSRQGDQRKYRHGIVHGIPCSLILPLGADMWADIGRVTVTILASMAIWLATLIFEVVAGDANALSLYRVVVVFAMLAPVVLWIWVRD